MIKIGDTIINAVVFASYTRMDDRDRPQIEITTTEPLTAEQYAAIAAGEFQIVDENGNVEGTWTGYTTPAVISYRFLKIEPAEAQIAALESRVAALEVEAANNAAEAAAALDIIEGVNV